MLGQVRPTDFDLYFPVGKIPVRVTPWFWVLGVFTGYWTLTINPPRPDLLITWIVCLFVSIVVHELGHAFAGQYFGWRSQVFLYHFGGVAQFPDQYRWTPGKWVFTCFAGPGAGFILYGLVVLAEYAIVNHTDWPDVADGGYPTPVYYAIYALKWINLYWGLVNLLPVFPLDGGQIANTFLEHKRGRRGAELACQISFGVGLIATVVFFSIDRRMGGYMFLFLSIGSFQRLQMLRNGMW